MAAQKALQPEIAILLAQPLENGFVNPATGVSQWGERTGESGRIQENSQAFIKIASYIRLTRLFINKADNRNKLLFWGEETREKSGLFFGVEVLRTIRR